MKIRWSRPAQSDLDSIFDYIAEDNPAAAERVARSILQSVERLQEHPGIGRPGRVPGTRELVIAGLPYIVVYRLAADRVPSAGVNVTVLRVLRGAMGWPPA